MEEIWGPQRRGMQGLDAQQEESANRAILGLLKDDGAREFVDLVITCRDGTYEVWSERGLVRFQRWNRDGRPEYRIVETIGCNPIANQDPTVVSSCAEELAAAAASGQPASDPNLAWIEDPEQLSYPHAYERIAQLFDSPHAPDLVVSPRCSTLGQQPGQHGALDVVQSRGPLAFVGPGIRAGRPETAPRHVDIAPTIAHLLGFPKIDGSDWSGRTATERGCGPDVYLKRQDGRVLEEILDEGEARPERAYLIVFDGLSHSELEELLERDDPAVRNVARLLKRGAHFRFGSTVNFPSITWPSHATILTGAWCGHHDIVNLAYYDRTNRQELAPQAQSVLTEGFLGAGVETLYEACHRVFGQEVLTVALHEPQGRGARHAPLEQRLLGSHEVLFALAPDFLREVHPRYEAEGKDTVQREAELDAQGMAQMAALLEDPELPPPLFVAHEFTLTDGAGHEYGPHGDGLRTAIAETDRRLGWVLDEYERRGWLETTLFIFTSDHGMAAQQTSLRANPARHPERAGMKVITGEPMIWLRDMEVTVEAAADGRTARVIVRDHDPGPSGEKPVVEGAEVLVHAPLDHRIAQVRTNRAGVAGFATPSDADRRAITLSVRHPDYNARHLRLDGTPLTLDLRKELYGR